MRGKLTGMLLLGAFEDFFLSLDWGMVLFVLMMAFLALGLFASVGWSIHALVRRKEAERVVRLARSAVTVIRYDYRAEKALTMVLTNPSSLHEGPLTSAYVGLPLPQQMSFKKWLGAIRDGKEVNPYLQSASYFEGESRAVPCFFRLVKHDPEAGIIHCEKVFIHEKGRSDSRRRRLSSRDELAEAIKNNGYERGALFLFRLNSRRSERDSAGRFVNSISPGVGTRFCDLLYPYARGNQLLVQSDYGEVGIAHFDIFDKDQALDFALHAIDGVAKAMPRRRGSSETSYSVTCGVVLFSDLLGEGSGILPVGRHLAELAYEEHSPVLFYDRSREIFEEGESGSRKGDVERIISERRIQILFRPIYNVLEERLLGYLSASHPDGTAYQGMEELKSYAARVRAGKTLFSYVAKETFSAFENQRAYLYQRLFFPVMAVEIDPAIAYFKRHKNARNLGIVLLFREGDVSAECLKGDPETIREGLRVLRGLGCQIALLAEGQSLLLDDSFHSLADYFFADFSISDGGAQRVDTKIRSRLHGLVEKLLRYKKPIVASGIGSWSSMELLVRSGIDYVSGEPIGPWGTMVKPLQEKTKKRLKSLREDA